MADATRTVEDGSVFSEALVMEFEQAERGYQGYHGPSDATETGFESDSDGPALVQEDEDDEKARVDNFMTKTCNCRFGPKGTPCSTLFDCELIATTRMNCREMTKAQLDLVVLANLEAHQHGHEQEAYRTHIDYFFHGHKVCKNLFLFVHSVGSKQHKNLVSHFVQNGLTLRTHGNTKRLPANTVPFSVTEGVVEFISTMHALPLPGRMPGQFSDEKVLLFSSDMSKRYVYRQYCSALQDTPISRRKFETLWCQLLSHISAMKPKSDLCETCHLNITMVLQSANQPDAAKSDKLKEAQHHLDLAKHERQLHNDECLKAKEYLESNTLDPGVVHFSFDFAQQIHFPSSPQQVGPLYFLTPRKCQIFGVCSEANSEQVNYLIDENDIPGKGANCVVSMLHHYLETHSHCGQEILLHADNAVGQNKNNVMMQYLCWRILSGRSQRVKISFMIAGHTKFAPDRFFGLLKKCYRKTDVSSLTLYNRLCQKAFLRKETISGTFGHILNA